MPSTARRIKGYVSRKAATLGDYLKAFGFQDVRLKTPFLEAKFQPGSVDRDAAWDLYVELVTRITTQPLTDEEGVEEAALDSVHKIFQLTRDVLHRHGRGAERFSRIAIVVLNQVIRPFTARWHKALAEAAFRDAAKRQRFRQELEVLRQRLAGYCRMLADMAEVEDLSSAL